MAADSIYSCIPALDFGALGGGPPGPPSGPPLGGGSIGGVCNVMET